MDQFDLEKVWNIIRKLKTEYVSNSCSKGFFLDSEAINTHFQIEFEQQFMMNYSQNLFINMNITEKDIMHSAEMFIYLNFCPESVKPWILFYNDLFKNEPPNKIILTLNRILKGKKNGMQAIATKLFTKLEEQFGLHFRQIQNLINGFHSYLNFRDVWTSKYFLSSIKLNIVLISFSVSNHPVHFLTEGKKFPSAFIPFCDFGGNPNSVGAKIEEFDVPICNSFQSIVLNDQLCYEVDLNKFSNKDNIKQELTNGFVFTMDYNEDRQITFDQKMQNEEEISLLRKVTYSEANQHASIYLNTIGLYSDSLSFSVTRLYVCVEPVELSGEGEYNLNVLKEIEVTPYFLGLDQTTRFCQNEEMFESCTTRQYIDTLLEQCGCLPFNIRMSDKVLF